MLGGSNFKHLLTRYLDVYKEWLQTYKDETDTTTSAAAG